MRLLLDRHDKPVDVIAGNRIFLIPRHHHIRAGCIIYFVCLIITRHCQMLFCIGILIQKRDIFLEAKIHTLHHIRMRYTDITEMPRLIFNPGKLALTGIIPDDKTVTIGIFVDPRKIAGTVVIGGGTIRIEEAEICLLYTSWNKIILFPIRHDVPSIAKPFRMIPFSRRFI